MEESKSTYDSITMEKDHVQTGYDKDSIEPKKGTMVGGGIFANVEITGPDCMNGEYPTTCQSLYLGKDSTATLTLISNIAKQLEDGNTVTITLQKTKEA